MTSSKGAVYAVLAYVCWGLFPFYWKQVAAVPSEQVIAHRVVWSFVMLTAVIAWRGDVGRIWRASRQPGVLGIYTAAALLISGNWYGFIWGVSHNFIVETSLGYFINPLVSVVLGVVFFRERLRSLQWAAVGCATAGVLYLAMSYGRVPWLSLWIALTFAGYGAVKKKAPLAAENGLTLETSLLVLPALVFLVFSDQRGVGAWGHVGLATTAYLTGGGLVTTIPLLLFASAVQVIPLTLVGILQFVMPTLQFLSGVLAYGEPFAPDQRIGFGAVWAGLVLFGIDSSARREPSARTRSPRSGPSSLR